MRFLKFFALLVVLNAGTWLKPQEASAQQVSVSFQMFYDELSPYGMWVDYPDYGYVWIPDGYSSFSPYESAGHWIFTEDGWTWVSDYAWGWAPFHYGRWDYDTYYGWFWVPDDVWGPAWVSWRRSPGYFGWAPLRPGISADMAFGRDYHERNERWIFVRDRDITRPDIGRYYVNRAQNVTIINNSTVIVNTRRDDMRSTTYITGPSRDDVQKATRTAVNRVTIRDNAQPGHRLINSELQIYRPQIQRGNGGGRDPAPNKVLKRSEVTPASERNVGNRQQRPGVINPPPVQPSQPPAVGSSRSSGREQQQRAVSPAARVQPSQPQSVVPSDNKGKRQPSPLVKPPATGQPAQPCAVVPSDNKGRQQQQRTVIPSNKTQPSLPQAVNPSDGKAKEKQPQNVVPPTRGDRPQPMDVSRSNNKGQEKQQLRIAQPKREAEAEPPQPKEKKNEKENKREQ